MKRATAELRRGGGPAGCSEPCNVTESSRTKRRTAHRTYVALPSRPARGDSAGMLNNRHIIISLATAAVAITPSAALAKHGGDDAAARGSCSKNSSAKLKLGAEDGRIEAEFEVDQNRSGVRWRVVMRRNGARVASTTAVTRRPSGSFEVRRVLRNGAGTDRITARATSPSGEVCTAQASF